MYDERLNDKMNSQPTNVAASAVERLVKWLKRLLCQHAWLYNNEHGDDRTTRDCPKCKKKQVLCNSGGCHGETWWQSVAT